MDPFSAFGLACNVIQVVDFGSKALAMCKEMYDRGALAEYQDLEETTKHLMDLRKSLNLSGNVQRLASTRIPQQNELLEVAKQCSETAEKLVKKLQSFSITGRHKKRQAFSKAFKALWEQKDIQNLQRQLDAYQTALDTRILIDLRQSQDLASLQQRRDFQSIDHKVQMLIFGLAQGPKRFEELRTLIQDQHEQSRKLTKDEHAQTRDHFTKSLQEHDHVQEEKEYRKRLRRSLWFDELYSREERIKDAHPRTFKWILDKSGRKNGPWDNFVEWLELGQGIYWISGKPGSGKSTLMSFICRNDLTVGSLRIWSAHKDILILKFYFWSGGTRMEKSIEGMLRSLIWQILDHVPDLQISNFGSRNGSLLSPEPIAAWTERRLRKTFKDVMQQVLETHNLCFFLDGLDEFDGDQDDLVSFIHDTVQESKIKMCLSSRPYRAFDQAFGSSAKLRLQDFTKNDIRRFVVTKFQDVSQMPSIPSYTSDWLGRTTDEILERAEGVFLWVDLAVKDQINGLKNGDSPEQLEESLETLPDEIEGIYARMLSQIKKPYRKEASKSLQIALHNKDSSLLSHVLAARADLDEILSSPDSMPEDELIASSDNFRNRITTTCAGLLEVIDSRSRGRHEFYTPSDDEEPGSISDRGELYPGSHSEKSSSGSDGGESHWESSEENADSAEEHLHAGSHTHIDDGKSCSSSNRRDSYHGSYIEKEELGYGSNSDKGDWGPGEEEADSANQDLHADSEDEVFLEGKSASPETLALDVDFDVAFIHRTAVDFMNDRQQGGVFLNSNGPADFDPQVFYVKFLLARLKLSGLEKQPDYNDHQRIEGIMRDIWLAEHQTGIAQTKLCSLMDEIMGRIDQNRNKHEDCHWSARWGRWELMQRLKDIMPSISKKSSKSSLSGSACSDNLQSETLDDSNMILCREPSFLSLAASYGLVRYVRHVLDDRRAPLGINSATYVLYTSVLSIEGSSTSEYSKERIAAGLLLVNEMLRQGANSNTDIVEGLTICSYFLDRMHRVFHHYQTARVLTEAELAELQPIFSQTTLAFCESGANLKNKYFCPFRFRVERTAKERYQGFGYSFVVELSVLAIAEIYLNNQNEISRIREMCISSGAPYYARCMRFEVKKLGWDETIERYDMSEAESDALLEILKGDCGSHLEIERMQKDAIAFGDKFRQARPYLPGPPTSERMIGT